MFTIKTVIGISAKSKAYNIIIRAQHWQLLLDKAFKSIAPDDIKGIAKYRAILREIHDYADNGLGRIAAKN